MAIVREMKKRVDRALIESYLTLDEDTKRICCEALFAKYWKEAGRDVELAIAEIKEDIVLFETYEHFERCAILKDILLSFE